MVNAAQPYGEPAPTWPRPASGGLWLGLWLDCGAVAPRPATELKCIGVRLRRQQKPIVRCGLWRPRRPPAHFTGGCRLPSSKPAARNI